MESLSKCDHLAQIYLSYLRTMDGLYRALFNQALLGN